MPLPYLIQAVCFAGGIGAAHEGEDGQREVGAGAGGFEADGYEPPRLLDLAIG